VACLLSGVETRWCADLVYSIHDLSRCEEQFGIIENDDIVVCELCISVLLFTLDVYCVSYVRCKVKFT